MAVIYDAPTACMCYFGPYGLHAALIAVSQRVISDGMASVSGRVDINTLDINTPLDSTTFAHRDLRFLLIRSRCVHASC